MADAEDYSPEQLDFAIRESVRQDVRKWAYVHGILKGGCKGMGKSRASPPPVKVGPGGVVMMPSGGGTSDNRRR